MITRLLIALSLLTLAGCGLPVISTDFDPGTTRKVKRTGTNFAGKTDLPRSYSDTELKYMGREETENLLRRQGALKGGD
jgi:hypothetical protein